jgi:bla regulator protein blaR1
MQSIFIECAVRSSLIAAAAGLVLWAMRIKMAAARHAIWTGVTLAMLLLPAFAMWGPKAPLPVLPRAAVSTPVVILPASDHAVAALAIPRTPQQPLANNRGKYRALIIPALYLAGVLVFLLRLGIGAWHARALVRETISCAAPVTLGWIDPKVILPPDAPQWPQARLDAVLAHEREHARRRDPLWQLIALVNRALFWFHPLAWWLERRLSGLAEEACDAAVLARGFDARNYSECLLDLARSVQRSGARIGALSATMPGIGLEYRIRTMLSGAIAQRVSRVRMVCAVGLCLSAIAIFSAGTLVRAQDAAKGRPEFEVASIRPSRPGTPSSFGLTGGANVTLKTLIAFAYRLQQYQILNGPGWIGSDRFDIQAKAADPKTPPDQMRLMLQSLLADRLKLAVHHEIKLSNIYALVVAKGGPKIKLSADQTSPDVDGPAPEGAGPNHGAIRIGAGSMIGNAVPLSRFATLLSQRLDRTVIDKTNLTGRFDIRLQWTPDVGENPLSPSGDFLPPVPADASAPSVFTAIQEQLGLKLEAAKGPVDFLVIDHAEKPSEN